ncbi:MAG TPA: hypothetical protein VK064_08520 [Wenzhouxiangella sp.]|nr:hypothetical protein [Wenzhouxiangella sp.]
MSNTRTFSKTNHLLTALALLVAAVALALAPAAPAAQDSSTDQARSAPQNWFGGVVYDGDPDLELTAALVEAGTTPDGTFWSGYLFDKTLSHGIHNQVMADIEAEFGHDADESTHLILNQAMYDVAQALGMTDVALADLH